MSGRRFFLITLSQREEGGEEEREICGKQMSSTPLSHSNLIFTICHIKAQTHSDTVGIHAPTGDFG